MRFCESKYFSAPNALSKIVQKLHEVDSNATEVWYRANRRFEKVGKLLSNGFDLIRHTDPEYWYINPSTAGYGVISRHEVNGESGIESFCTEYDPSLDERTNMYLNNYRRVYDPGKTILSTSPR
jgi:hypothetical protein